MLKVDLGHLERKHRLSVDAAVRADDPLWDGAEWTMTEPLEVNLELQQAGPDVVALGTLSGAVDLPCRRCLAPVGVRFKEEVTLLFRAGIDTAEAERDEVYALPAKSSELDLGEAVREQVLLAVPRFTLCAETCRGFCPSCGVNLNDGVCDCTAVEVDERWAALRRLASE